MLTAKVTAVAGTKSRTHLCYFLYMTSKCKRCVKPQVPYIRLLTISSLNICKPLKCLSQKLDHVTHQLLQFSFLCLYFLSSISVKLLTFYAFTQHLYNPRQGFTESLYLNFRSLNSYTFHLLFFADRI
jgi:hypothetical protein